MHRADESGIISSMNQFDGVIFDFNGTMFFDNEFHIQAWIAFAARYGVVMTREIYIDLFHGLASKESLEQLLGRKVDHQTSLAMQEEKEAIYRQLCLEDPQRFRLAPGLEKLLDELSETGVPRAIATASAETNVTFFIAQFRLGRWFEREHIVFDDGSFRNKPHPDIYLRAAERLRIPPRQLVVVEDSLIGAAAAERAGTGRIVLTGEHAYRNDELDRQFPGTLFIRDFDQFPRNLLLGP